MRALKDYEGDFFVTTRDTKNYRTKNCPVDPDDFLLCRDDTPIGFRKRVVGEVIDVMEETPNINKAFIELRQGLDIQYNFSLKKAHLIKGIEYC